jgi:hypothetical protein
MHGSLILVNSIDALESFEKRNQTRELIDISHKYHLDGFLEFQV